MNALVPATPSLAYGDIERLAASIAKSGLFGMKTADQAMALMMISQAEGRHPALAARDYDIIQNRPAKKAEAMLRDFFDAGGKVEWHKLDDTIADATFSHPVGGTARISWDMPRATKAGLLGKDMYKKFPRQMLRSRTVSEGVRTVWPLATSGMYVPEEARDIPPEPFNGTTIEAEPTPQAAAAPRPPTVRARPDPDVYDAPADPLDGELGWEWLRALKIALRDATSRAEVVRIGGHPKVGEAIASAPEEKKREISDLLADAYGRFDGLDTGETPEADAAA